MISDINDYFASGCGRCDRFGTPDCSTQKWILGLKELRSICLAQGLAEVVKWGHPCYVLADRNIAIIGAHRSEFRISFFSASLLKDEKGILKKQGKFSQYADTLSFIDNSKVAEMKEVLISYLKEAKGYALAGIKAPKVSSEVQLPIELADALECDAELAEAFYQLTPGRQKSYAINLYSAKNSSTRVSRIAKFRSKILAGKGAFDR